MSITLRDVAKEAGVSISSASRVINNDKYASESLKKKVNDAIKKTNYKPNMVARSLKINKTRTIGIVFPDIIQPFTVRVVKEIERYSFQKGYNSILSITENNPDVEKKYIDSLQSKQIDGFIILPFTSDTPEKYEELLAGMHFVSIDRQMGIKNETCIKLDNFKGMNLALEYLIGLGHERIGIVNIPLEFQTGYERFEGYKKTLKDHQIKFDPEIVKFTEFKEIHEASQLLIDGAAEKTLELINMNNRPTAILSTGIFASVGILRSLIKEKVRIPDDMSFVSFDELFEYSELLGFSPTAIRQPVEGIAKLSIKILLDKIDGQKIDPGNIALEPELIIRESCKKIT